MIKHAVARREAEKALQKSVDRFDQLAEQSGIVTWEIDANGLFTYVSQVSEAVWGYRPDELVGMKHFFDLFPESIRSSAKARDFKAFERKERFVNIEDQGQTKDGKIRWVFTNGIPILNADKTLQGYRGIVMDITERKRAEKALRESDMRYRLLLESASEAIIVAQDGMLRFVNPASVALTGFSEQELTSSPFIKFIHPEDRAMVAERYQKRIQGRYVFRFLTREKTVRWAEINAVGIDWEGRYATLDFLSDITERKIAEGALLMANRKLNLLSSITRHDINNQLVVLTGNLTLLDKQQFDHSSEEHIQKAEAAAERITAMIRFTKDYEDVGVHAPIWQDVRTLVDQCTKEVQPGLIKVVNDVPTHSEVLADPLIAKVFHNLIQNAMQHGGCTTTICFSLKEQEGIRSIVCEDDGVGIPAEMKEKLFTRDFGKDHGLGLFLAMEILAITGITITEQGEPRKGAKFVMTIPMGGIRG